MKIRNFRGSLFSESKWNYCLNVLLATNISQNPSSRHGEWPIVQLVKLTVSRSHHVTMKQTKLQSLQEAITNVAIGFAVSILSQLILYPLYNIHISLFVNVQLTLWFTVISIARTYFIRRYHDYKLHKNNTINSLT